MKQFLMLIALWPLIVSLLMGSEMKSESMELLIRMLEEMDAHPERYVLHHSGRLTRGMSTDQLNTWMKKVESSLGLTDRKTIRTPDGIQYVATSRPNQNILIRLTVILDEIALQEVKPYLSLQVSGETPLSAHQWKQVCIQVTQVLKQAGIKPRYDFNIQGSTRFVHQNLEDVIHPLLQKVNAKEVEAMRTPRTVSISAYSPKMGEGIHTGNQVMNFQAAARLSHDSQHLIVTLGTPIITIEY